MKDILKDILKETLNRVYIFLRKEWALCPDCDGSGSIHESEIIGFHEIVSWEATCKKCNGKGIVDWTTRMRG